MANKESQDEALVQLTLPDFIEQLTRNPGKPFQRKITEGDIGGQLLAILSRGLYSDPLDFIREYIQNAVDGRASNVSLRITGRSVSIEDDGIGMSVEDLLEARKVGVSPKSLWDNVGFRGIGIYSSFDVCNRLYIASKKQGTTIENILEFDFEAMRQKLELSNQSSLAQGVNLTDLITDFSMFRVDYLDAEFIDRHYTRVYLDELNEAHFRELVTKPEKLRAYILRNVPIDFSDEFEHKKQINNLLKENTNGYNPVVVHLEVEGQEPQEISRPAIPDLREPQFDFIKNSKGVDVAFYWACLHKKGKVISSSDYAAYRGFTYKVRGFSIGSNTKLKDSFGQAGGGTLYNWYFGEIYVLDKNIKPNSARSDFEPSEEKTSLEVAVEEELKSLYKIASNHQQQLRSDKVIFDAEIELNKQEKALDTYNPSDLPQMFRTIANLAEKIEDKVDSASDRSYAQEVLNHALKLQKRVHGYIDRGIAPPAIPLPTQTDQTESGDSGEDQQNTGASNVDDPTNDEFDPVNPQEGENGDTENALLPEEDTPEGLSGNDLHKHTLVTSLTDLGYEFDDDTAYLLRQIDVAISETVGYESGQYTAFLEELDRLLSE